MVGIVVDQMRWDYLYRYYKRYGSNGFKRLIDQGFSCNNTMINYLPTKTAIGHSSIYTGSVPAIHGIAGNDFISEATGEKIYCTADSSVFPVGTTWLEGKMSPKNLWVSTIGDELRLATNFRSKVIGVSLKDRGAILPAGHAANAAYWYDGISGKFISSSYYMLKLPIWVKQFNSKNYPQKFLDKNWATLYPIGTYVQSSRDSVSYEQNFNGSTGPFFPVKTADLFLKNGYGLLRSTPFGNTFTLDFAKSAVINEKLGQDEDTDLLAISLSSSDYIGHQFAPNSVEIEDTYLRLDRDLASFFLFLDSKIGKGNYTIFLTADHGGAHNMIFLAENKLPGKFINTSLLLDRANKFLEQKYKAGNLIVSLINSQVHLNNVLITKLGLDANEITKECVTFFENIDGIHWAADVHHIEQVAIPAIIKSKIINGYNRKYSGRIFLILKPGWLLGQSPQGTDHGNWNPYDSHIPLLWMGWGIRHGSTHDLTEITDIAPTACAILKIQMPSGNVGKPIAKILK